MRQFLMFGVLQLKTEGDFFFIIYFITINFQEISDVISALKSLPLFDLEPQETT